MLPSHCHIISNINTLTNPNGQPYLKSKFSGNNTVKTKNVPGKHTATSTDIPKTPLKINPRNHSDPSNPTTTRPMHLANGLAHRHAQYLNSICSEHHHNSYLSRTRTTYIFEPPRQTIDIPEAMSSADDRTDNNNSAASRGRRGGNRAFRGRNRGRGFHFGANAQQALTQHLMRRGIGL